MTSRYGAMTKDTLTHDVHGTKVRHQLNKTANDTRVIESRVAHERARLDRQQAVFSILNHTYLQTMNK